MLASQKRRVKVVEALLEAEADPDIIDNVRVYDRTSRDSALEMLC